MQYQALLVMPWIDFHPSVYRRIVLSATGVAQYLCRLLSSSLVSCEISGALIGSS